MKKLDTECKRGENLTSHLRQRQSYGKAERSTSCLEKRFDTGNLSVDFKKTV